MTEQGIRIDLSELNQIFAAMGWYATEAFVTEPHSPADAVWTAHEFEVALSPVAEVEVLRPMITITIRTPMRVEAGTLGHEAVVVLDRAVAEVLGVVGRFE